MTISATIIADSISPQGIRLTTFQLRYPRFIHAELMTHRTFSRNASSSRAIPVTKLIEDIEQDPAIPIYWGSNKPGMQAGEEINTPVYCQRSPGEPGGIDNSPREAWLYSMELAIMQAENFHEAGYHKQIVNRILEPWAHINVVVTATDYENFYALRRHSDAQPEIKDLADKMWLAQNQSTPTLLQPGEWHLPYITDEDRREAYHGPSQTPEINALIRISVARCARVSYLTHDGRKTTWDEDLALYEKLVGGMPLHASPAEHQATPDMPQERAEMMAKYGGWNISDDEWEHRSEWGNFRGWRQFRKQLPGEFTPG